MYGEKWELYNACKAMCDTMNELGIALDGGKDSLSMVYKDKKETIKCPRQLVISGYAPMEDIRKKVTPDFKSHGSTILYIDLANRYKRLGGSCLFQAYNQMGNNTPKLENPTLLANVFNKLQYLIDELRILSGHDISDGGFITTLCEMAFGGNIGFTVNLDAIKSRTKNLDNILFNEELGLVIEVKKDKADEIIEYIGEDLCFNIGSTIRTPSLKLTCQNKSIFYHKLAEVRDWWENTNFNLELKQCNPKCVKQERDSLKNIYRPRYLYNGPRNISSSAKSNNGQPKVAIIREEGSNGDREMASAFYIAGFDVYDICMNDFIDGAVNLAEFRGIAFVGGFSYSDVFGSANGWYNVIKSNLNIEQEFKNFYERSDTFSLGICNGCQLMARLGWIPECELIQNESGRFESRFSQVKINKTNSIMLQGMENANLGVWVAHGEGRFKVKNYSPRCNPVSYIDPDGKSTAEYPFNPNGSDRAIAGMCSRDGRHLAMMPHPERSILAWQWPVHEELVPMVGDRYSPWIVMFKNAYKWCINT